MQIICHNRRQSKDNRRPALRWLEWRHAPGTFNHARLRFTCIAPSIGAPPAAEPSRPTPKEALKMDQKQASLFARLALAGIQKEYPNKPDHVLNGAATSRGRGPCTPLSTARSIGTPRSMATGCWSGCCDGSPTCPNDKRSAPCCGNTSTAKNLQAEADYFAQPNRQSFERTYGWAWLLKLAEELHGWDDPDGRQWSQNIQPLADAIVARCTRLLSQADLSDPQRRASEHGVRAVVSRSTTRGPWATSRWRKLIEERSRFYFASDAAIPAGWEPSGTDFLSPSLVEADLMRRVLPPAEFRVWLRRFLPELARGEPEVAARAGQGDRPQRSAACASGRAESEPRVVHAEHRRGAAGGRPRSQGAGRFGRFARRRGPPHVVNSGNYMGEHWLALFAVYLLSTP